MLGGTSAESAAPTAGEPDRAAFGRRRVGGAFADRPNLEFEPHQRALRSGPARAVDVLRHLLQHVERVGQRLRILAEHRPQAPHHALMQDRNADVEEDAVSIEIDTARLRVAGDRHHFGHGRSDLSIEPGRAERHGAGERALHHVDVPAQLVAIDRTHRRRRRRRRGCGAGTGVCATAALTGERTATSPAANRNDPLMFITLLMGLAAPRPGAASSSFPAVRPRS